MLIDYKKRHNKSNKGINRFLKRHIKSKRDIDLKKRLIQSILDLKKTDQSKNIKTQKDLTLLLIHKQSSIVNIRLMKKYIVLS